MQPLFDISLLMMGGIIVWIKRWIELRREHIVKNLLPDSQLNDILLSI